MTIIRSERPKESYYVLRNDISGDKRLSWAARGLLIYLLSKPDNWSVSTQNLINETAESGSPLGRDGVYAIIRQLMDAGYVKRKQLRENGKMSGYQYEVSEICNDSADLPFTAEPYTDLPFTAETTLINTDSLPITDLSATTDLICSNSKNTKQSSKSKQEIITPDRAVFDDCRKRLTPKGKERLTLAKAWTNWQALTKTHGTDLVVAAFNHWNDSQDCQKEGGRFQGDLAIWLRDKASNIIELLNEGTIHDFNANHHNHANQLSGQGNRAQGSNSTGTDDGLFGYLMGELSKTERP
jgi:DNA replication protein DnaC